MRVFYQIWDKPLMTINNEHLITRVMELCGGRNVFGDLPTLTPHLDVEGVLVANPQAIVASGMGEARPDWLDHWRRWPDLTAVKNGHLFFVPPDFLQRPTPRILDGAQQMCEALEQVRKDTAKRGGDPPARPLSNRKARRATLMLQVRLIAGTTTTVCSPSQRATCSAAFSQCTSSMSV